MKQGFPGPRGHPNGPPRDIRAGDGRGRIYGSPPEQLAQTTPPLSSSANLSRAERFEDEKKRIIGSCFSKEVAPGQCE